MNSFFATGQVSAPDADTPIGIFDSGVGGLTVARAIIDQLPGESLIYVGDTKNSPYGPLPIAQVRANALGVMDELVDAGVKLLVIAEQSLYLWQRLRIERVRRTEPEHLEPVVESARTILAQHVERDGELLAHARAELAAYAALKPLEVRSLGVSLERQARHGAVA